MGIVNQGPRRQVKKKVFFLHFFAVSAKERQREMTKWYLMGTFFCLPLEFNPVIAYLAGASF